MSRTLPKRAAPKWVGWSGTSLEKPRNAKEVKDELSTILSGLVSGANEIQDEDSERRVYLKFLNGRVAILELFDEVDEEIAVVYAHHCSPKDLRRWWTTTGAAIAFGIGFVMSVEDDAGELVEVILRRAPEDTYPADGFAEALLKGVITESTVATRDAELSRLEEKIDGVQETVEEKLGEISGLLSSLLAGRP
jgi:hypothetical protein